jgi:hypothetical protein
MKGHSQSISKIRFMHFEALTGLMILASGILFGCTSAATALSCTERHLGTRMAKNVVRIASPSVALPSAGASRRAEPRPCSGWPRLGFGHKRTPD